MRLQTSGPLNHFTLNHFSRADERSGRHGPGRPPGKRRVGAFHAASAAAMAPSMLSPSNEVAARFVDRIRLLRLDAGRVPNGETRRDMAVFGGRQHRERSRCLFASCCSRRYAGQSARYACCVQDFSQSFKTGVFMLQVIRLAVCRLPPWCRPDILWCGVMMPTCGVWAGRVAASERCRVGGACTRS